MKYIYITLICLFAFTSNSYSQERTLTGVVRTLETIAVVNAEVKVLSSNATVLTNAEGKFKVYCLPNDKIKVSAKSFKSQKVKIDEKTKETVIDLTFNPTEENVVLAVGYGYIKEEDKSYAISYVNNNNNSFAQYSSMIDVIINSSTSVTYDGAGFIIRGGSSLLGSSHALIIINGQQASMTLLNTVPPFDVKSVDILKGAASSIYGSRGANGVIIVNTKKRDDVN